MIPIVNPGRAPERSLGAANYTDPALLREATQAAESSRAGTGAWAAGANREIPGRSRFTREP